MQSAKRIEQDAEKEAVFVTAQDKLVPDPVVYSDWFDSAPDRLRKMAVGVRRYNEMEAALGEAPAWVHFLDPESGDLLPRQQLKQETPEARDARVMDVLKLINRNRELTREVWTFGFMRSRWWRRLFGR